MTGNSSRRAEYWPVLLTDFRYALRSLAKSKGFAAIAILSLALALGLNTTVYGVLDSFMHPYTPYREPNRLVRVSIEGDVAQRAITRYDRQRLIRDRVTFAQDIALSSFDRGMVLSGSGGEEVYFLRVSPNYFSLLDVSPERGRTFRQSGDESTVVVSHALWSRLLGRRPLTDLTVTLDGKDATVIGVMPPDMYPTLIDAWQPFSSGTAAIGIDGFSLSDPLVRLKPGATIDQVRLEMTRLAKELSTRFASRRLSFRGTAETLVPDSFRLRSFHWALAGCAFLVLIIACANLANLMLARGVARRGELALRLAIGASRKALVWQLVAEAVVLAAIGGALGVFFAAWGISVGVGTMPRMPLLTLVPLHVSWRMFAVGFLTTTLTVILFGLIPALRASDVDVAEPLKEASGATTGRRNRRYSALAIAQMGLALVVLMAAAVLAKSARRFATEDWGYDLNGLYNANVDLRRQDIADRDVAGRFQNVRERVARIPGVKSAATYNYKSTAGRVAMSDYERKDDSLPLIMLSSYAEVSAAFLRTQGTIMREGRGFEPGDRDVAIVNRGAATRLWPNLSPVGRMIKLGNPQSSMPWLKVVGVIAGGRDFMGDPNLGQTPEVFVMPSSDTARVRRLVLRVDGSDRRVVLAAAQEIQAAALLTAPVRLYSAGDYVNNESAVQRLNSRIFMFLGFCALGLAAMGLYGVLAYTVSRRVREFGVRIALGATNGDVFRLVLHDGTVMFLAGTALGAFAAMAGSRFLDELLYRVEFTDVLSLVVSELILCGVAFLACLAPARRAMRADPMEILRAT